MQNNKENRLVITQRGVGARYEQQFFTEIQKAVLNGYRIAETNRREDMSMRNFRGKWGRAVLYKEGFESVNKIELEEAKSVVEVKFEEPTEEVVKTVEQKVETVEPATQESVEAATKVATDAPTVDKEAVLKELKDAANKDALKALAEKYNLEVDPNKKHPEALRKALVAQIES